MIDAWRLAVGTLTAVPMRPPRLVDRRTAGIAMVVAPLAVVPLGVVAAGVLVAGHLLHLPALVSAFLALAAVITGNRAFHLDGLADTVDGLAASRDAERSLAVMKTGTAGPAGVVAVVLVVGLQVAGLASLASSWRTAALAGVAVCTSRGALALCCARAVPPARADGLGVTFARTVPHLVVLAVQLVAAAALSLTGWWAGLAWWRGPLAAAFAVLVVVLLLTHSVRRIGGVTGDVLGAAVELALAAELVALS